MSYAGAAEPGPLREQDGDQISIDVQCFMPIEGYVRQADFWNTTDVDIYVYINATSYDVPHLRIPAGGAKSLDIAANQQADDSFSYTYPFIVCFRSVIGSGNTGAFWVHTTMGKFGRP